jgi:hypothetical protein
MNGTTLKNPSDGHNARNSMKIGRIVPQVTLFLADFSKKCLRVHWTQLATLIIHKTVDQTARN